MRSVPNTCLAIILATWIGLSPAADLVAEPLVDKIFAEFDSSETPGCALGVIREGEFIYRRGYGMANLEYDIPLSSRSVFRIASTSKQFTAMAIALLAESGQISLDDPLSQYFPEFPDWAEKISVRQLIHHTSGIRDYLTLADLSGKDEANDYFSDEWALALLARQREGNFPPGTEFLYSNSGYFLLGHLVQRSSGQSLKEFSERNIFAPLGMKSSHFHDDHTHIVKHRAAGYAPTDEGFSISMTTLDIVGDGSVYTTIDDLLLWDRNFYRNQLGKGSPELITLLTTTGRLSNGEKAVGGSDPPSTHDTHYAFGLYIEEYRGLPMISHDGTYVGFRAEMIRFPEQRFSVAVLCNRSDAEPSTIARRVADVYLADLLEPDSTEKSQWQNIQLSEDQLQRYTGDFWDHSDAVAAETQLIGGKLWAVHSPERRNELVPVGPDRFKMIGLPTDVIVEYTMSDSAVQQVSLFINGYPNGTFKPFSRRKATAAELAAYAGDYYSPELEVHYLLQMEQGKLMFRLPGQNPQELTPMFAETFENPDWGAFDFMRDQENAISGFRLQSGRVRNLEFTRQ